MKVRFLVFSFRSHKLLSTASAKIALWEKRKPPRLYSMNLKVSGLPSGSSESVNSEDHIGASFILLKKLCKMARPLSSSSCNGYAASLSGGNVWSCSICFRSSSSHALGEMGLSFVKCLQTYSNHESTAKW